MGKLPTQTYQDIFHKKISAEYLRNKLKIKHLESQLSLKTKHPIVDEFFKNKGLDPVQIREHSARVLSTGALASALLLSSGSDAKLLPSPQEVIENGVFAKDKDTDLQENILINTFKSFLPKHPRPLARNEEKFLEHIFLSTTGIPARASLEGEHLNTTYGYIGYEQHLRRYPGDKLNNHGTGSVLKAGMAPGRGAWGYFASTSQELSSQLEETEKWYAVVQTLYLPDWSKRTAYLRDWYKYRKVLIVNTQNGHAVVAAIADSGPAAWTGKQFGGSPEVMEHLGGERYRKGAVIVFFVDDPQNKIPLGPVDYSTVKLTGTLVN